MVILFDQYHLPEDVFEVIFATDQQITVAKMLVEEIKKNKGVLGKTEMSFFANQLHDGITIEVEEGPLKKKKKVKMSYNKRQFYDRILTPMKAMGMIDYDLYNKKYKLSDRFTKVVGKIGVMWQQEVHKPPKEI